MKAVEMQNLGGPTNSTNDARRKVPGDFKGHEPDSTRGRVDQDALLSCQLHSLAERKTDRAPKDWQRASLLEGETSRLLQNF